MKQHNTLRTRIMAGLLMAGMVLGSTAAQAQSGPAPTTASGFRMYNSSTNWITIRASATAGTGTFLWPAPAAGIFKSDPTGIMSIGLVQNTDLQNNSITINTGTGLTGGGVVALGGTLNLSNTGVTSLLAGPGINVSGPTGAVTVNNTGVLSAIGTTNQVNVSSATGNVTFSLPQNIHTNASPTFDALTLDNLTGGTSNTVLVSGPGGLVQTRTIHMLPNGTVTNATLVWNGTNWVENPHVTMNPTTGDVTIANNGDLIVNAGGNVVLPNGVINNNELENNSVTINTGTGLAGGGNVALGGTLNLTNTGVTSLLAGPGISVSGPTGAVTVNNTGVLSAIGTANQVNVSSATGNVTFSLPQNIHTNASPTFDAVTLDNLTAGTSNTVLVSGLGGLVQTRTIQMLPTGTTTNATLVWNGTNWVENTLVTMNPTTGATNIGGDLTVTGPNVNLPAGSVSNTELQNSSVTINTGAGLSGGGVVALGGTLNLANTGVTSLLAGPGISVSGPTGAVTVNNTGVLSAIGTANQVNVSSATGNVTFSLPQDIHTNASPTFDAATLDNLTTTTSVDPAGGVLVTNGPGLVQEISPTNLVGSATLNQNNIWVGNALNKPAMLPPGGNGNVLQIVGSTPTWVAPAGSIAAHGVVTGTGTWTYTVSTGAVNPTGKAIMVTAGSTGGSGSAPQMTVGVSNVTTNSFDIELPVNIDATVKLSWTVIN